MRVPLKHPRPDIENFKRVILREKEPERPPFVELHIDKEIVREVVEKELDRKWVEPLPDDRKSQEAYLRNHIECWYRLGYDCLRHTGDFRLSAGLHFACANVPATTDTMQARSRPRIVSPCRAIT